MINIQVAFPPGEEFFNLPAQLVNHGNLFAGEIVAIGGHPVFNIADAVADNPQFFFSLIGTGCAQQSDRVVENDAAR